MSVGLGTLKSVDNNPERLVEVDARSYDADHIQLTGNNGGLNQYLVLDRRQMQELSVIIDRFMDK